MARFGKQTSMYRLRPFAVRILNLFRRSRIETDLREQLEAHREAIQDDLMSRGMNRGEAEIAARRSLGNELLVREFSRDEMVHRWIDSTLRDLRYAARSLAKAPTFSIAVVLTLALGIGANTAIFSIVDRILLRPLPFPEADRLMLLQETGLLNSVKFDVNPSNWMDWQRESQSFETLAVWSNRYPMTLSGQGEPERLDIETVSYEFLTALSVKPFIGRVFSADDDRPQAPATAVITHSLWQRKFAGDPNIAGKVVEMDASPVQIVGVMPPGFRFLSPDTDAWIAFRLDRNLPWRERAGRFLPYVVGRLKPAVTQSAAQAEMRKIAARLADTYAFNKNTTITVSSLREVMTGEVRTSLIVLFAAVSVLLLIACSNVANLLVARSAHRRREIAIRSSLGAGRLAIVRQLLIESLVLSLLGGVAGIFIARWSMGALLALAPTNLVDLSTVGIDRSMLLYTIALSVLTGILVGLAPAMPSIRIGIADHLRTGGRSVTASTRLRQGLIVTQVALTILLLCGAGLLLRSLLAITSDPIGVDPHDVLSMRMELPQARYNPPQQVAFFRELAERLQNLPGVQSVGGGSDLPVSVRRVAGTGFRISGQPEMPPGEQPTTRVRVVMPGYFKTLGIPLIKGRDFTHNDSIRAPQVFIVNEAFAEKFFPGQDPLSASLSVAMRRNPNTGEPDNPFGAIVGVVGDVKERSLRGTAEPTVFYNYRQLAFSSGMSFLIRSTRGRQIAQEATQIVREIDRNLPVIEVQMLDDVFADSVARERLNAVVSSAFAACALLLASLGLYGLLAYTVTERTSEIGIRMALGARAAEVMRMVMAQGLLLVLIGVTAGLAVALVLSQVLESLLFGVTAHDPLTFATVTALLVIVGLVACVIPARRAMQVNPIVALRNE